MNHKLWIYLHCDNCWRGPSDDSNDSKREMILKSAIYHTAISGLQIALRDCSLYLDQGSSNYFTE